MNNLYLTPRQVSQIYGFNESTQINFRQKLALPYYKIGKMIRYKKSEFEEWLETKHKNKQGEN